MFRRTLLWIALGTALAPAAASAGDKLSKDDKKWLEEEVAPIILPSEEKLFKDLKSADRAEFQKIFWARRDPNTDLESLKPDNAYKAEYLQLKALADERFKGLGRPGSLTDCGRIFVVLGEPDQIKLEGQPDGASRRGPETWVYREKPNSPIKFSGGEMQVSVDQRCDLPEGATRFREQLRRLAELKVIHPDVDYRFGKDGRLVKLADLLPKPSPGRALLKEGRKDFALETEDHYLKVADGGTALVGLVQGDATGLAVQDSPAGKTVKLTIAAQATNDEGRVVASYEQATNAVVTADGHFLAAYRLGLKPGHYTVHAAAIELSSQKGSVVDHPVDVPDFNKGELTATLIITGDLQDAPTPDPTHPFAPFQLGNSRIVPRFGSVFAKSDSLYFFYQYYDAQLDEQTGKASVVSSVVVKKGEKPVARAGDQPFDAVVGGTVIGPVPLEKYEAGDYQIDLKLTDNVAKKSIEVTVPFAIK